LLEIVHQFTNMHSSVLVCVLCSVACGMRIKLAHDVFGESPSARATGLVVVDDTEVLNDTDSLVSDANGTNHVALALTSETFLKHWARHSTRGECDSCNGKYKWQFVLGTGRSGTTSVLSMVDAIPGFFLSGENMGMVNTFHDIFEELTTTPHGTKGAWRRDGNVSEDSLVCAMQDMVRLSLGSFDEEHTTTLGFKEIRFHTFESIAFLRKLFPCARFIVVTRREPKSAIGSGWWDEENIDELVAITQNLTEWQRQNEEIAFPMYLEDFSVELFNEMLAWLGVTGCEYTRVAHSNKDHGYNQEGNETLMTGTCLSH